ncbi:MAG TPA: hypothetical protein VMT03_00055 [Polyangia bacterium]|nr:hypothetical protein [Polyangia bacterium]
MRHIRVIGLALVGMLAMSGPSLASSRFSTGTFVTRAESALAEGHPGVAILNLERARLLSPNSAVVAGDLARARLAADLPAGEPVLAGTPSQLVRTEQWGRVALAGLTLAVGSLVAVVWKLGEHRAFAIIAVLGVIVAAVGFRGTIQAEPPPDLAVVVAGGQSARVAPSGHAPVSFRPSEGSIVLIDRTRGPFALISVNGLQGWILRSALDTILPKS